MIEQPNRYALSYAIDVFRDAMRPFIVRCLKRALGERVKDIIRRSLSPIQADQFDRSLILNENSVESALDVNFFPPIIKRNWREVFFQPFNTDISVQNELWLIRDARNRMAHPGQSDLDAEYVLTHLFLIINVLGRINAPDQQRKVKIIRDGLRKSPDSAVSAPEPADAPPAPPPEPSPRNGPADSTPQQETPPPNPKEDPPRDSECAEVKIADIQPGHSISGTLLAVQVRLGTARTGSDFMQVELRDASGGSIMGFLFDPPRSKFDTIHSGVTVDVQGCGQEYRGFVQQFHGSTILLITSIEPAEEQWDAPDIPRPALSKSETTVSGTFLARQVRKLIAKNGNPYFQARLYGKSGRWVIARWFNPPEEVFDAIEDEMTVDVSGYCQEFQGQRVVYIDSIEPAEEQWSKIVFPPEDEQFEPDVIRTVVSEIEVGESLIGNFLAVEVERRVAANGNDFLRAILQDAFGDSIVGLLFNAPESSFEEIKSGMTVEIRGVGQEFQGSTNVHLTSIKPVRSQPYPDDLPF